MKIYPLLLDPVYKSALWGGHRIAQLFHRKVNVDPCSESWELSDREDGMCRIKNGAYAGKTLKQLVEAFPLELVSDEEQDLPFPLLVKLIDAKEDLSVQVHPPEEAAKKLLGLPKSEMWVVLDAKPGAFLYLGLNQAVSRTVLEKAFHEKTIHAYLRKIPVTVGDVFYVPAGTIHSLGKGIVVLEIQQNSNTTYRIYDWDRKDQSGKTRELHVEEALESITPMQSFYKVKPVVEWESSDGKVEILVDCPYFLTKRISAQSLFVAEKGPHSFHYLFVIEGSIRVIIDNELVHLKEGESCLIPAACEEYVVQPLAHSTIIQSCLP